VSGGRGASFAVIDVETTGLSARSDRVLEIAVVRVDAGGVVVDEWATRLDPQGPVGATHIHGITAADVAGAPVFSQVAPQIANLIGTLPVVAHNARFDLAFLTSEFARAGWDVPALTSFCTLEASDYYWPRLERRRLADCCQAAGIAVHGAHSALGDARATAALLGCYLAPGRMPIHPYLGALRAGVPMVRWPVGPSRPPAPAPMRHTSMSASAQRAVSRPRPRASALIAQVRTLSMSEILDGAPPGTGAYLEVLATALVDGELSATEIATLAEIAAIYALTGETIATLHARLLDALAYQALADGVVSRAERAELGQVATALGVPDQVEPLLRRAEQARAARMSAGLRPLPANWALGEPLRVGDRVVFTGCEDHARADLERRASELGVRVMGKVSRLTKFLVTDGTFSGTKANDARELGVRTVHPKTFRTLLTHLQPAIPTPTPAAVRAPAPVTAPAPPPTTGTNPTPGEIRTWALAAGYVVGDRGRLPREVTDAYRRAHTPAELGGHGTG
jgi:DNA polymerase-3 subunit epsilon